jgi:hypothetical protein
VADGVAVGGAVGLWWGASQGGEQLTLDGFGHAARFLRGSRALRSAECFAQHLSQRQPQFL